MKDITDFFEVFVIFINIFVEMFLKVMITVLGTPLSARLPAISQQSFNITAYLSIVRKFYLYLISVFGWKTYQFSDIGRCYVIFMAETSEIANLLVFSVLNSVKTLKRSGKLLSRLLSYLR